MLMLLAISIPSAWATDETVTFSDQGYSNQAVVSTYVGTDFVIGFDKGSNSNAPKYYTSGTAIRAYGGKTMTVQSNTKTITEIVLTFGTSDGSNAISTDVGTYSNGTWTGSASTVVFTIGGTSGNRRLAGVAVTYATGGGSSSVAVASVSLDEDEIALEVGEKQTLIATVLPDNATNKGVTWESDDTDIATVVNGLVTAVAPGTATITCKSTENASISTTCDVTVTAAEVPTLTFDFSAQNYTNGVQYSSINADANITITFGDGANDGKYYTTGTAIRVYGGGHMTVTGGEGVTISKIVLEFGSGDGSNEISTTTGTYTAGRWTGSEQSVTFNVGGTSGNRRIKIVKVFYDVAAIAVAKPTISGETPFLTSTTVSLTQADADHIYYTTNGDAPTTSSTEYNASFELNATTTVKAIAVKGSDVSDVAEATFTKVTIMTVAEAKAAIDAAGSTPIENQYVTGIISQIDSYNGTYKSIQYWISADGTTDDQLEVYSGKGLNGADFAGLSDLSLGDEVIVKGTLKKYNSIYEFDKNSQIVQLNRTIAAPTFTPSGGGFLTTLNVSLASATEGAEVRYTTDGSDPTSTSTLYENSIELSSTTTIKAAAFKGEFVSVIVTKTFTKGTKITVAAALDALNSSSPIADQFVYGKISTAPASNPSSGRLTYYISDDGTTTNQLEVYNGFGLNGASFTDKTDLQVGDEVTVYGTLKIYNEKKEFDAGNYLLEFNRPEVQTYSITYEENGGAEVADVAEATNLPDPLPTTTKDNKAFGGWFTDAEFNTPAVAGAALTSNVTLYAKWNDISAWASVYTSNVTLSIEGGTNASAAKVKLTSDGTEYDALKAGTSSKVGAVVVTVPDGATKLHFHAYGWNGENVTLGVTAPTGVTVSPASVNIAANTGVTSNSPFTLAEGSDPKTDAYYAITLSGNTGETALTFTATSGKRFVLFGVNQEGAATPASIAVNPTSLAFGSVEQGANIEAKTINVTLTEVAAATVTLAGDGAPAFSIDKEALNASGIITVTPNTTNVGTYAATITISDNASEAESVEVAVSMTVTEPMAVDDLSGTWTLVTEASQLVAGKKVIIASVPEEGSAITMSTRQATNNRPGVSGATIAENAITAQSGTAVFTLEAGTQENTIAFKSSANEYLCAASSTKNYLHSQTENDDNGSWTISIAEGVATITAQGTYSRNVMRYNPNNGSPIFACYASDSETGTLITLYVQESEPEPELNYVEARTELTVGKFYTICMPQNILGVRGATFWNLNNRDESGSMVYFVEAEAPFAAGKPYIFIATATTLEVAYGEENAGSPVANGALRGTFSAMTQSDFDAISAANSSSPIYMLVDNQLRQVAGRTGNSLGANRAYVIYNELQAGEPTPAPGRRVLAMPMNENVATGIDALGSDAQPSKIIVNGQLFIIRDGKAYDATGRQVSKF